MGDHRVTRHRVTHRVTRTLILAASTRRRRNSNRPPNSTNRTQILSPAIRGKNHSMVPRLLRPTA